VFSRDVCGCFSKRVYANIGCCGDLRFLSFLYVWCVFLMMFPEYFLMSCVRVTTYLVGCVGVTVWFGWGGVVSVCRLKHYWSVHVGCGDWGLKAFICKLQDSI